MVWSPSWSGRLTAGLLVGLLLIPVGLAGSSVSPDVEAQDPPTPYASIGGGILLRDARLDDGPHFFLEATLRDEGVVHDPWSLAPLEERTSPLGTHHRYRFVADGLPLLENTAAVHVRPSGSAWLATQSAGPRLPIPVAPEAPLLSAAEAGTIARSAIQQADVSVAATQLGWSGADDRAIMAWQVDLVRGGSEPIDTRVVLDAAQGQILDVHDRLVHYREATGNVFLVSPMVAAKDHDMVDVPYGLDAPYINIHQVEVDLLGLDDDRPGELVGEYANHLTGVTSTDDDFRYQRSENGFQDVMVYHHADRLQRLFQSLGFDDVNNESQDIADTNILSPTPNAFYSPSSDSVSFYAHTGPGANGDAAEDAEVVLHELGHAVHHDQVTGWGGVKDQGSMGEGFGDFLGAAVSAAHSDGFGDWCGGEWLTSHAPGLLYSPPDPPCIRILDNDYTYSQIGGGAIHTAGQIWSGLLYDVWQAYDDPLLPLRIALASHFLMDGTMDMPTAVDMLILADRGLYGGAHGSFIAENAHAREIAGPLALWVLGLPGGDPDPYPDLGKEPVVNSTYAAEEIDGQALPDTTDWTVLDLGDEQTTTVTIPTMPFYDANVSSMVIVSNGIIGFGDYGGGTACCYPSSDLPTKDGVEGILAPFWTDLDPGSCGTVAYDVEDDRVRVAFVDVRHYRGSCDEPVDGGLVNPPRERVTFHVSIQPSSGTMEVHLVAYDGGNIAVTGIEDPTGTVGNLTRGSSAPIDAPLGYRFTRIGAVITDPEPDPDPDPDPEPEPVDPYTVRHHLDGRLGCALAAGPVNANDLCRQSGDASAQRFRVPLAPQATAIHVEVSWEPNAEHGATRLAYSWTSPATLHGASGGPPIIHDQNVSRDDYWFYSGTNATLDVALDPDQGLVRDQAFHVCVVVRYGGAALPADACDQ